MGHITAFFADISKAIVPINDFLWNYILVIVLVGLGLFFTFSTRFVQFRHFRRMFALLRGGRAFEDQGEEHLSSFQALIVSLAGRVGGGAIVGVAAAISLGGPGSVFWLWVVGLIGMGTSFIECTLAQAYKRFGEGRSFRGGPSFYIIHGLGRKWRPLAALVSILLFVTYGFCFNGVQSYAVANSVHEAFHIPMWILSILLGLAVAAIIMGGLRRIAKISDILVPLMIFGYMAMAVIMILVHIADVPAMFHLIIKSAFGLEPMIGGGIGAAIAMGVRRSLFSSEAGLGSAPNVAATADVNHPADQGVMQAFSVFIDTVVVCSCTAFIILLSGVYQPGAASGASGIVLAQDSLAATMGEAGRIFLSLALMLFAFTTIIYNYFLGENSLTYFGIKNKAVIMLYRAAVVVICMIGAFADLATVFSFADLAMGLLACSNIIALAFLIKPALRLIRDYDDQLARGIAEPIFDAAAFNQKGIDTEVWNRARLEKAYEDRKAYEMPKHFHKKNSAAGKKR